MGQEGKLQLRARRGEARMLPRPNDMPYGCSPVPAPHDGFALTDRSRVQSNEASQPEHAVSDGLCRRAVAVLELNVSRTLSLPKLDRACRDVLVRALPGKGDDFRRFELTVSSEYPVGRWFGQEVLIHTAEAVDLSRFNDSAPVLLEHDRGQQIGVIEPGSAKLVGRKLRLVMRFSRANPQAALVAADVEDGIRRNVSVSYIPLRAKLVSEDGEDGDTWEVTRWQPLEVSVVSVPADPSVGFDRAAGQTLYPVEVEQSAAAIPNTSRASARGPRIDHLETRAMNETETPDDPSRGERRAAAAANQRVADITHIALRNGMADRLAGWLGSGKSADQIARELLDDQLATRAAPGGSRAPEFRQKDLRRYSYARAIHLSALAREGKGRLDGLEAEVSQEIERALPANYQRRGGVLAPMDTRSEEERERSYMQRSTMTTFTPTQAPELVSNRPGELIELLRAKARVISLGATTLPGLTGPVPMPKQKTAAIAHWVAENPGSDVAQSNPTFGTVLLAPKTLQAATPFSRQLLVQASLNVEQLVRNELASAHGLAVDRAAIHGTGIGAEPLGIYGTPDVNTQAFAGAISYANVINMLGKIADDNADTEALGLLTTALAAAQAMKTPEFATAGSKAIWTGPIGLGTVAGCRAASSTQVSKTMSTLAATGGSEHGLVFGNWSDLLLGFWGALELIVDPYTLAGQGLIKVTSFQMADVAVKHGESFCVATGQTVS